MSQQEVLFSAKGITKSFSGNFALKGVDLEVHPGEIVGLVGENGAGKSTLLKIIIGAQPQTDGTMTMHGKSYQPKNPMDGNREGIGMVFQEQSLIVNLNVAQNIFFGHEKNYRSKAGFINWGRLNKAAEEVLHECDIANLPVKKKVIDLNFATRQMVEIAKVVNVARRDDGKQCLILLDEPTSVLNEEEVQTLFKQMRKLASKGHGVVFVSHRLDEVLSITDRIYVYKDGSSVASLPTREASEVKLYELMVGRDSSNEYYQLHTQIKPEPEVVLETRNLGKFGCFKNVSFQLHKGEILGFCGVVGSGIEDICSVICGDESPSAGKIFLHGKEVSFSSPANARKDSILMIPKERLAEGIVGILSVEENIALSNLERMRVGPFVQASRIRKQALSWINTLKIKTPGPKTLIMSLSGGNQQKVVFSRALASESDIIILNHPTRGVDVGAREEIYTLIRQIVARGKSVILLGDTLDECIGMSSRIIVMKDGLITAEFDASVGHKPSQVDVVSHMM